MKNIRIGCFFTTLSQNIDLSPTAMIGCPQLLIYPNLTSAFWSVGSSGSEKAEQGAAGDAAPSDGFWCWFTLFMCLGSFRFVGVCRRCHLR
jgi:hypothetical protein